MTLYTTNHEVRSEVGRILSAVGDSADARKRIDIEEQLEALPPTSKRRNWLLWQMRSLEPPTSFQTGMKRTIGFGAMAAIGVYTLLQGDQALLHYLAYQASLHTAQGDIQTMLQHFNIFTLPQTGQQIYTNFTSAVENINATIDYGVKTAAGTVAEVTTAAVVRPWKRPQRRGFIFGIR